MAGEINNYVGEDFLQYLYVLDSTYTIKLVIDTFSDLLWTERYCGYGEFEITIPMRRDILDGCLIDDYIMIRESDKLMIVETIGIHDDLENGATIKISGRTLESLLSRRVILDESIGEISEEGEPSKIGVQDAVSIILTNNLILPSDQNRGIPGFAFRNSKNRNITDLTMEAFKARGDNVYDKVLSICHDRDLGFRVNAIDGGGYEFELYSGTDRTFSQDGKTPVVFSDSYENLLNSDYLLTETDYKTTVYVEWNWSSEQTVIDPETETETTETENGTDVTEVYRNLNPSGLRRRESYTTDRGTHDIGPDKIKDAAINQVTELGKEYLSDYKTTEYFDGETNPYRQFVYGIDYILGDIVELENRYGRVGKCRITEIVRSRDSSGAKMCPTFETIEGDDT